MKIELKNISHNAALSEETHAYSASLYVDGRKIGTVSNHGHGGCDDFHGDMAAFKAACDWVEANMPATEFHGMTLAASMVSLCCDLVNEHLALKDLRRLMKRKALFVEAGESGLFQTSHKGRVASDRIAERNPGAGILNLLPESEALALYLECAA